MATELTDQELMRLLALYLAAAVVLWHLVAPIIWRPSGRK